MHEETGHIDPTRFGWDNRITGGARLGSSISRTIVPGLTIDATGASAFWLGFTRGMQYNGLDREAASNLPGSETPLTNCFASMYSFLTSVDIAGYNWQTLNTVPGTFKGFDVLVLDPTHIIADFAVNYEMCELGLILDQFAGMASLDYAAIGDNTTRYLGVILYESPEARDEMVKMRSAAVCAKGVADDYQAASAEEEGDDFEEWDGDDTTDTDSSLNFAADPEDSAKAGVECFALVDRFVIGEISGKLFSNFFNNQLKPLI